MTIKLSTTNSVNKTLQHKALWGLKHHIGTSGVGSGRVGSGRGGTVVAAVGGRLRSDLWTPEMERVFPLSEIHRILYQFQEEWRHYYLSSSVNKLSISRSRTTWFFFFQTAKLWRRNKHLLGPSGGESLEESGHEMKLWMRAGDYVWIICAAVFSSAGLRVSQVVTEKPSGPVASLT